jgi:bifunctional NMN adenylyltransferase/nudix hydrolase
MQTKTPSAVVGVLIGRFQTPELHSGHRELIDAIVAKHQKVVILLGNSVTKVTRNNPLDFYSRKLMINSIYPNIVVLPVKDMGNDEVWSKGVDSQIRSAFDIESVVLYGSRDGFVPYYKGKFPVIELEATHPNISGTEIRKLISEQVRDSYEFRAGLIYAAYNKFPIVYPTVDAVLYNEKTGEVLLGKKKTDGNLWRFPGGFVDPNDNSKEESVARELQEEVGFIAELSTIKYVGSIRVEDYRYSKEVDKIMTTIFHIPFTWGMVKGADDLDEVKWFKLDEIIKNEGFQLVKEHKPFVTLLQTYFKKEL